MNELERFFLKAWEMFLDAGMWEPCDLLDDIETCGLAKTSKATQADIDGGFDGGIGDPILTLTEVGRAAIQKARE